MGPLKRRRTSQWVEVTERMKRVDLLTSREVAAAVRSARSAAAAAARQRQLNELIAAVELHRR